MDDGVLNVDRVRITLFGEERMIAFDGFGTLNRIRWTLSMYDEIEDIRDEIYVGIYSKITISAFYIEFETSW